MELLGKKMLIITAHPDDESFFAAGTMYKNYLAAGTTALICATFGEKGKYHFSKKINQAQLKDIRKRELLQVSKLLKIKYLFTPGLPDGRLKNHSDLLFSRSVKIMQKFAPDFILSFGPDGMTGHLDHLAIHSVSSRLSKRHKIPLFVFTFPEKLIPKVDEWLSVRKKSNFYAKSCPCHRKPDIKILVDPKIKLQALKTHRSQFFLDNPLYHFPKKVAREVLKCECFAQVS